jgi:hypothetical protein
VRKTDIGDLSSSEPGSAARDCAGKPDFSLLPLRELGYALIDPRRDWGAVVPGYVTAVLGVGEFQETRNVGALRAAVRALLEFMPDAARAFDYGRAKYAAWNWPKGMAWSVPVACIGRHAFKLAQGEALDAESGCRHEGHIICNLLMLIAFVETYPEGDDLPPVGLLKSPRL